MDKNQLIHAMLAEHPLVSLPIGMVNTNSKWAVAATTTNTSQSSSSEQQQQQQQQDVSACIQDIVGQVRMTKRHAQEFLGTLIEAIFEHGPTEDDRVILNSLCPAVKSKIHVAPPPNQDSQASSSSAGTLTEDEGEEDAEEDDDGKDD
ncbi:hypothetical protein BGZ81_005088, partial [Podila clonocystis]